MSKDFKLMNGDNIELLKTLPNNCIDSIVTDPPYGINFMGKKWDYDVPTKEFWLEVYRVLKPGGHILSFCGTRTYHRMVVNIEDAGFEIRDQIDWVYGSGFPKSHNIALGIDKQKGNSNRGRAIPTASSYQASDLEKKNKLTSNKVDKYEAKEYEAKEYEGWGTALKPAHENICLARKPLSEKTVAENVLKWKTGGINIDGCRIGTEIIRTNELNTDKDMHWEGSYEGKFNEHEGRFPANIILDEEASEILDKQSGILKGDSPNRKPRKGGHREQYVGTENNKVKNEIIVDKVFDSGGASRFFYCPKVSKKERNLGCEGLEEKIVKSNQLNSKEKNGKINNKEILMRNIHPTVKPIKLLTYLCRLITPKNGLILDPFMGSGSTGIAALLEGFRFCGMELDKDYFEIATKRITAWEKYKDLK